MGFTVSGVIEKDAKSLGLILDEGLSDNMEWASQEADYVKFPDERLSKRYQRVIQGMAGKPGGSIPEAAGNAGQAKASYRFCSNSKVETKIMQDGHKEASRSRIESEKMVLAVQDTTSLNHSTHSSTEGLGPIGSNSDKTMGFLLHPTIGYSVDRVPLGILDCQFWARDAKKHGDNKKRNQKPISEKESWKWVKSYEACQGYQKGLKDTLLVNVGDREADIYELFQMPQNHDDPQLLVRAQHNRGVEKETKLWEFMSGKKKQGEVEIKIPRKGKRPSRTAILEIRFSKVMLKPPCNKKKYKPLQIFAVWAHESQLPRGEKDPVSWMLLTTLAVHSMESAVEKLRWYTVRWQIEVFFRILKSGCKAEKRQLKKAVRLEKCLFLDMLIARRIQYLTMIGRTAPERKASVEFSAEEWQVLYTFVNKKPPTEEPTLGEMTKWIAQLGGFLGRKSDGDPGTMSLWRGLRRLEDIVLAWRVFNAVEARQKE